MGRFDLPNACLLKKSELLGEAGHFAVTGLGVSMCMALVLYMNKVAYFGALNLQVRQNMILQPISTG